jgi:hypothetical protein
MRSRGEIERVLQEAMVESAVKQRGLLIKRLSADELAVADGIMDDLRVSYGHAEHRADGWSQCHSCGVIESDNKAVLWAFHPGELLRIGI